MCLSGRQEHGNMLPGQGYRTYKGVATFSNCEPEGKAEQPRVKPAPVPFQLKSPGSEPGAPWLECRN
jgi:hypothetical protein